MQSISRLSVNVNKIATLRNSRGGNLPSLVKMVQDIERFGAEGITVHPRPDERHIRYSDVRELKPLLTTEFNIEGYPDERFLRLVEEVNPQQCTLVPDPPGVLTSDTGWDVKREHTFLKEVTARLRAKGIRSSLFINPDPSQAIAAAEVGADRIEIYTGAYAQYFESKPFEQLILPYQETAKAANEAGLGINAGHDLNLSNLKPFKQALCRLDEVSIGHALICDALYLGIENTVQLYLRCLKNE
jgi:pyridoxine 5-phosphate synthase